MTSFITMKLEEVLSEQLAEAIRRTSDLSPAMAEIAGDMKEATKTRFATESGLNGVPWKRSERAKKTAGAKTLQKDGYLNKAIILNFGPTFAEVGVEAFGPAKVYAKIHQFGGTITPKHKKLSAFS